ncbi:hypothetical protein D3C75_1075900 [compost metagenome]
MIYIVASVASRSGIRSFTISSALRRPMTAPITSGTMITTANGCWYQIIKEAVTTVVSDTVAPTERSNPSTIRDNVTPIATNVTIEIEPRISVKLLYVKK